MEFDGKVAIVTGGAKGIGREIGLTFARAGADVVIADMDVEGLRKCAEEIRQIGRCVVEAEVDISDSSGVQGLVAQVIRKLGKIDILVNNAADIRYGRFLEFKESDWDRVMNVSLKGYFLCSQLVAREMVKRRKGKIISLASVGGEVGFQRGCAYCSAKGGVIALTRVMAIELASYGINANAIAPGPTDTGGLRSLLSEDDVSERIRRIPLGRFGFPRDIAKAALFLASEDSNYITGHILHVDGGFLAAGTLGKNSS
jgi:3-oxoacyl-[acyl-carrier protein] reductase